MDSQGLKARPPVEGYRAKGGVCKAELAFPVGKGWAGGGQASQGPIGVQQGLRGSNRGKTSTGGSRGWGQVLVDDTAGLSVP